MRRSVLRQQYVSFLSAQTHADLKVISIGLFYGVSAVIAVPDIPLGWNLSVLVGLETSLIAQASEVEATKQSVNR
jgi:hypothetical protein